MPFVKYLAELPFGEEAELFGAQSGLFCCPICGYPGVDLMHPIPGTGLEVFDHTICPSCSNEYGADDVATRESVEKGRGVVWRWSQLREIWLKDSEYSDEAVQQLLNIGVRIHRH